MLNPEKSGRCKGFDVFGAQENQIKSNQIKSNQIKSNQIKSNQVKSSQVKSSQVKSSQVKSSQVKSSQVKSGQVKSSSCHKYSSLDMTVTTRTRIKIPLTLNLRECHKLRDLRFWQQCGRIVFRDVSPCRLVKTFRHLRGTYASIFRAMQSRNIGLGLTDPDNGKYMRPRNIGEYLPLDTA